MLPGRKLIYDLRDLVPLYFNLMYDVYPGVFKKTKVIAIDKYLKVAGKSLRHDIFMRLSSIGYNFDSTLEPLVLINEIRLLPGLLLHRNSNSSAVGSLALIQNYSLLKYLDHH